MKPSELKENDASIKIRQPWAPNYLICFNEEYGRIMMSVYSEKDKEEVLALLFGLDDLPIKMADLIFNQIKSSIP